MEEKVTKKNNPLPWLKNHKLMLALALALIIVGVTVCLRQRQELAYARKVNFQEYAPRWLPAGVEITGKKVNIEHDKRLGATTTTLNFTLNRSPQSSMHERQASDSPRLYQCGRDNGGNDSCEVLVSPQGQKYQLLASHSLNQIISLVKGTTYTSITLQGYPGQPYSHDTLNRIVDSFASVHYRRLPGNTSEQCQCGG